MIDAVIHPLCQGRPWMWIVDGILHGIVDGYNGVALYKFVKYNLKPMLLEIRKTAEVEAEVDVILSIISELIKMGVKEYLR